MVTERRRHPRLFSHLPLRYHHKGTSQYADTLTKDVSVSGVRFISHEFFPTASEFLVEVPLFRASHPLQTLGRVAWSQKIAHSDLYEIGMEFTQLPDEHRKLLNAFLDNALAHVLPT
ncbi:MAG: PilZ domain-containing protein [Candidatus Omnitrophica bacterium]|nr:PilZ domain-containing protein [Candidatus Omnitrophota bacterium]